MGGTRNMKRINDSLVFPLFIGVDESQVLFGHNTYVLCLFDLRSLHDLSHMTNRLYRLLPFYKNQGGTVR